ncbi:HepT-like ribonuclease domain-containing protein [Sphingomonas yunnanensis]|uniref:HepT-like ribonuclease domain-containing protein n=1 Tax=Sphingomonas yunnanensis TaxID=310400 RepID=UPI001FECE746|nr:HepT-like ribonuclease domain-containing protein [Sphingomonas yunnanensis]
MRDIVDNAARIDAHVTGLGLAALAADGKTIDACERCLERIAEAVVKLGAEQFATVAPDVSFERVRGLGNVLRRAYDDIDLTILFGLVHNEVPALRLAALRALEG